MVGSESGALEAVDVVFASIICVGLVGLEAALETLEHWGGPWLRHVQGSAAEVRLEEIRERWHNWGGWKVLWVLHWVWGHEENWGHNTESGNLWVGKHSDRPHVTTLEWVTGHVVGVSVVYVYVTIKLSTYKRPT